MKRTFLAVLVCGVTGLAAGMLIPTLLRGQTEISNDKLVNAMRLLGTEEYSYRDENGRFAPRDEMLSYLQKKGILSQSPIDLENPRPYELAITTSPDGAHYQISLQRPSTMNDKNTWCKTAAFSDDGGTIFLGAAIGCDAPAR